MSKQSSSNTAALTERLRALRDALLTGLVERDVAIRLSLLAALSGEHLLLIGPPGTAKSLVARRLQLAFSDATYFERLLTRFTVPEELFGPLSIKGLEEDRYERLTAAYLPTAGIAFLDEIFKANSAILNALLTLLNEREFDNGATRVETPLVAVVGASNELPEDGELAALFDRFLLRLHVGPVSKAAFPQLLGLRGEASVDIPDDLKLTAQDLARVRATAEQVEVPDDVVSMLRDLREWCAAEQIPVSDRRWRKVVKLLQVSALTNGRTTVSVWDCWLLQHCLWDTPEERAAVYAWYAGRVGASAAMDPSRLTRIVVSWEGQLKADKESRSQRRDEQGRLLYKGASGKAVLGTRGVARRERGGELLFLAPANASNSSGYGRRQMQDRTNGGKGYTEGELNELHVSDPHYGWQQFQTWNGRAAYLADKNNWLTGEVDHTPLMEPTRHKPLYIQGCLRELNVIADEVATYRDQVLAHIEAMEQQIRTHLWVTEDFVEPAATALGETRREVDALVARIARLRQGFELLPKDVASRLGADV